MQAARARAELSTSSQAKVNHLSKTLLKVRDYKHRAKHPTLLNTLERNLESEIHSTQLGAFLDEARKAEFKGQRKKALDKYFEALYFLRHDAIDDSLQEDSIGPIQAKIAELGGATS